jgi:predicted nucleic acid-binding protein
MIVVDTGVLLAVADADDRWHLASTELLASYPSDQLILPAPVIPETGWMIAKVLGPAVFPIPSIAGTGRPRQPRQL